MAAKLEEFLAEPTIEQLEALVDIEHDDPDLDISWSDTNGNHYTKIKFTRHPVGGRHMYVAYKQDPTRVIHVARDGGIAVCERSVQ